MFFMKSTLSLILSRCLRDIKRDIPGQYVVKRAEKGGNCALIRKLHRSWRRWRRRLKNDCNHYNVAEQKQIKMIIFGVKKGNLQKVADARLLSMAFRQCLLLAFLVNSGTGKIIITLIWWGRSNTLHICTHMYIHTRQQKGTALSSSSIDHNNWKHKRQNVYSCSPPLHEVADRPDQQRQGSRWPENGELTDSRLSRSSALPPSLPH